MKKIVLLIVALASIFNVDAQEVNLMNFKLDAQDSDLNVDLVEINLGPILPVQEPLVLQSGIDENILGFVMKDYIAGNPPKTGGDINMDDLHFVLKVFLDGQEIIIKPNNTEFNVIAELDDLVQAETAGDAQVPEPSAAMLIGAGVISFLRRRRLS